VSVYVPLANVESIDKAQISLSCTNTSFELTVRELEGKDYRLIITVRRSPPACPGIAMFYSNIHQSSLTPHSRLTPHFFNILQNLSEEIDTEASKFLVRAGKVIVILKKVEEKSWTDLRKKSDS
jgi:hypothetical protein